MAWAVEFFADAVADEIRKWPKGIQASFLQFFDTLRVAGPVLEMPDSRAMGGGLFELRCKGVEGIARVFYGVFSDDRELWLLHAFRKQTRQTPPDDLKLAKKRLKALREKKKRR